MTTSVSQRLTRKNCSRYLKLIFKKQLFDLEVKGHYGMRHTTLWSCTHIPNTCSIDLSRKTKKLWSGQASLRRSGRKNKTKTIILYVSLRSKGRHKYMYKVKD